MYSHFEDKVKDNDSHAVNFRVRGHFETSSPNNLNDFQHYINQRYPTLCDVTFPGFKISVGFALRPTVLELTGILKQDPILTPK